MENEKKQDFEFSPSTVINSLRDVAEFNKYISKDFFIANWKMVIIISLVAIIYITNRLDCNRKIAQIETLKSELLDIRYEALTRSSDLIGISRPSQVKELIRKNGIEIEESDKPAYNLND